ncbi:Fe-S protein assembly co-chaperone HscB [Candidatus Endobugula sertula]|uniref:Co-chaperone protein HscB homolog n=1 Tax=Candidatus Endobugula sertula TaxID=62101 RepID=A0A1D2QP35_9GAMM|nr:Fe-S protein assembly co-chaperone HscB [Candidatus Endobugula sertula]
MNLTQNYFELLGVPQQYHVDKAIVVEHYHKLQKEFHPDKFAAQSENEQRYAVQFAAYLNTAFQTLTSPVLCAEYLLELVGEETNQQSTTIHDSQFLRLQMEWRETLSEIAVDTDINRAEERLDELRDIVSREKKTLQVQFEQQYQNEVYPEAKQIVAKLHFVDKMLQEIEVLESSLFD